MIDWSTYDFRAAELAARQARAEAFHSVFGALFRLLRRKPAAQDCDTSWALAEAPARR